MFNSLAMLLIIQNGELVQCITVNYDLQTKPRIIDIFDGSENKSDLYSLSPLGGATN